MDKDDLEQTYDLVENAMEVIGKEDWENDSDLNALRQKELIYYHVKSDIGGLAMESTGGFYYDDVADLHDQITKALPRILSQEVLEKVTQDKVRQISFKLDNHESFAGEKMYHPNQEKENG